MSMPRLSGETDLAGFRTQARDLLAHQVPPEEVQWETVHALSDDLDAQPVDVEAGDRPRDLPRAAAAIVPASFLRLCEVVVLHHDPQRFALLYRLLWRLVHEPALRTDPLDADMLQAQQMAQSVRREMHKMKALLRFHPVFDEEHAGELLHLAWFEPTHHIVEALAPWFARRHAALRWAILTPQRSVRWDRERLLLGPGARRQDDPGPRGSDERWLAAYHRVFRRGRLAGAVAGAGAGDAGIASLEELKAATMRCRECPIGEHATQSVIGEGRLQAPLMLVGEQPGNQEDLQGHPFVGPAGRLLDSALDAIGIPREIVFVSNAVKHFKFELRGKRRIHKSPNQREVSACLHWLEDEIALVRPRALVALGATAARALLGRAVSVTAERGKWLPRSDGLKVLVTLHPSALLRLMPQDREEGFKAFVADLRKAKAAL
ncbi:UdgX family uracil-DNA binding protein [Ramlibacter tataouinensis]|uniref:UdgX family uracil-DNA binding protein n=1 Tax=Ramlibacter tataouinensis TaxID=94132 RepID=UPI0022F3F725|nr:UdgX family uracil-DNA binding protein [Ramlibacter tataouinensis]WBY00036.1 UdgX family uracil-DNA binding protein [Ramlibacter tataouinensis]